jgi:hypothetical protein
MRYFIDSGSDDVLYEEIGVIGALSSKRKDKSILFFVDHQPNSEPPSLDTGAFAVAPVSPAEDNMKEFVKHKCLKLWMPLPNIEEIISMKAVITPDMADNEFQRRLSLVGCMPRLILASDFDDIEGELNLRITNFDISSFIRSSMFNLGIIPRGAVSLSWWIVRVSGQDNLKLPLKISWGSEFIRERVLENQAKKDINILKEISCSMMTNPHADERPTGYFERWCVYSLAAGKELQPKIGDLNSEVVKLNAHNVVVRSTLPTLNELTDNINRVYYCAGVNNPSYDAAVLYRPTAGGELQLLLIQVTIGKTHKDFPTEEKLEDNFTEEKLEDNSTGTKREDFSDKAHIVTAAKRESVPVRFIFIVPGSNYFRLSDKQKLIQNLPGCSIEVCEWSPCV